MKALVLYGLLSAFCLQANDTVKVLFVYGSRPKTKSEAKWFGGIHGGHVSVQYGQGYASFIPRGKFHVVRSRKDFHSAFTTEEGRSFVFDTSNCRYAIISIPVTASRKKALDSVISVRLDSTPYDYAFIGMRCASSAYEVMSSAGIFPSMSHAGMVRKYFYPKKLRKRLLKEARKNHWPVFYRPGRSTRKWEND